MKEAIVTGGTRGIGLAVCKLLLKNGYRVTALYSRDEACAEVARKSLPKVNFVHADVASEEDVSEVFRPFSRLDLLVNDAGIELYKLVQDTSYAEWKRVMDVNAGGAFLCCKYAVKKMLESGGAIVNVSSVWGQTGGSMESAYSASKGALIAFTKALSKELAPSRITVNCVCPGVIDTAMTRHFSKEDRDAMIEEIPLMRLGTAEEVADAVLFLARNRYVTGEILSVNGGFYI